LKIQTKIGLGYAALLIMLSMACGIMIAITSSPIVKGWAITLLALGIVTGIGIFRWTRNLYTNTKQERDTQYDFAGQAWIKSSIAEVTLLLQGATEVEKSAQAFMNTVVPMVKASYGTVYIAHSDHLELAAGYAYDKQLSSIRYGQGLIGQCALDGNPIYLTDLPPDYVKVNSSLGEGFPACLLVQAIRYENEIVAVFEIAAMREFANLELELLNQLSASLGITFHSVMDRSRIEQLMLASVAQKEELQQQTHELQSQTEELQVQAEELEAQQESLRAMNEELEEQTQSLRNSEQKRRGQQKELEVNLLKMAQKAQDLEAMVQLTESQKEELKVQAKNLELTSKYKSEFLANMSHELRTPLNSMLILSQVLTENKEQNLTTKQKEYARTINASGKDLLHHIDELLDLSKVEAGKMSIILETVNVSEVMENLYRTFKPVAKKKRIEFAIELDSSVPETLFTDSTRLQQILRNLVSNAIKFTDSGNVQLSIHWDSRDHTATSTEAIAFSVKDTGIGISTDKLDLIFEAFQQADGSTNRKYGGTGLGLTISRELAQLLGGEIGIVSKVGEGSTFTFYLPETSTAEQQERAILMTAAAEEFKHILENDLVIPAALLEEKEEAAVTDDRDTIDRGDRVLLIVEDDESFALFLLSMARERGFKGIVALEGEQGLALAKNYNPDAIILDIQLPLVDGWSILANLKNQPETRHIPIHIVSGLDETQQGIALGALDYTQKPLDIEQVESMLTRIESVVGAGMRRLLIVEEDDGLSNSLVELIEQEDVLVSTVSSGEEALVELAGRRFDCMVLDLGRDTMSRFQLLESVESIEALKTLPIIIYSRKELTKQEELLLKKYGENIVIKNVKSEARLFDETALFLHRNYESLPEEKQRLLEQLHNPKRVFEGKQILLVDDDIRNVFALSTIMEGYNMNIMIGQNGLEALAALEQKPDIDLVLMDIMMPEMDGYDAIRRIRQNPKYERLPIIALTAKAMKEDRIKCLEAGASDYITKPIHSDQLFSLLKVWLYR
jgi:signal transduction histidine kinase/CheY-like chemotaxis protein